MEESYLPILILMLFAIGIAGAMILLSAVLGPRLRTRRRPSYASLRRVAE